MYQCGGFYILELRCGSIRGPLELEHLVAVLPKQPTSLERPREQASLYCLFRPFSVDAIDGRMFSYLKIYSFRTMYRAENGDYWEASRLLRCTWWLERIQRSLLNTQLQTRNHFHCMVALS